MTNVIPGLAFRKSTSCKERRIANDQVESLISLIHKFLNRRMHHFQTLGPVGVRYIFTSLLIRTFFNLHSEDMHAWRMPIALTLRSLSKHQGYHSRSCPDVQSRRNAVDPGPGTEQNAIGTHFHHTLILMNLKFFKAEYVFSHQYIHKI